ncbi:MAG: helix-hairpin-helix domain-containing protein [Anaerolineae bacterium]|jgi:competence protein ComEA|nr:helix-hairpin-helix domain-containing protein [Anaerolineae bacterium]
MEPDTQTGQEVELDAAESPKVDLNTAGIELLCMLPGIGPQLAMRILDHRAIQGPFSSPEDLTQVPGIGAALYERLADHVTVSAPVAPAWELEPVPMPVPDVEDTLKLPRVAEPPDVAEAAVEGASVADEEVGKIPAVWEDAAEVGGEEKPEMAEPSALPQPHPAVAPATPAPVPQRPGVSFWTLLWVALAGGLLGMLFSLLVLSGINGSLDVAHSRAVITMSGQVEDLTARLDSLQGDVDGLRRRLAALEGLTARMEKVETAAADLQDDFEVLDEKTGALSEEVTGLSEELDIVAAETEKAGTFFQGLQTLMADIFGAGDATPTATPAPGE